MGTKDQTKPQTAVTQQERKRPEPAAARTLLRIASLSERNRDWLKFLIYGPPGAAKTTFCGQAAQDERSVDVIHIAIEGGLLTLQGWDWVREPIVVDMPDVTEMERLYWALRKKDSTGIIAGPNQFGNYKTICIDSGTEYYTKDLEGTVARNMPKASRSGNKRESIDDIWLADRGESGARCARIFRWFRDLPAHLIVTAHPKYVFPKEDSNDGGGGGIREDVRPVKVQPAFGPTMLRHVSGYVDFVWAFEPSDGTSVHVLTQKTKGPYFVKTRNPNIAEMLPKIMSWPLGENLFSAVLDTVWDGKPMPEWASAK